jgi:hypothetical protein
MARRGVDLRRALTFGGQAPLSTGVLILCMLVATIGATAFRPLASMLVLVVPSLEGSSWVALFEVWRLVTWPFFLGALPGSLLTLLFAGFVLVWLGRALSYAWSERRFLTRFFVISAGAGVITLVLLAPFGWEGAWFGIWPTVNALIFTWGLIFPTQRISWFGVIEMSGATVAKIVLVGTPAWALLVAPPGTDVLGRLVAYLPNLAALLIAWLLVAGGPRRTWRRLTERLRRRGAQRGKGRFTVVKPPSDGPPRWLN